MAVFQMWDQTSNFGVTASGTTALGVRHLASAGIVPLEKAHATRPEAFFHISLNGRACNAFTPIVLLRRTRGPVLGASAVPLF